MTDRELLELAAKAAGIKKDDSPYNGGGFGNTGFDSSGNMVLDWHNMTRWNPLTDDGDALRLAVNLSLAPSIFAESRITFVSATNSEVDIEEEHGGDPCAATRRAIVRAAAELGRSMK